MLRQTSKANPGKIQEAFKKARVLPNTILALVAIDLDKDATTSLTAATGESAASCGWNLSVVVLEDNADNWLDFMSSSEPDCLDLALRCVEARPGDEAMVNSIRKATSVLLEAVSKMTDRVSERRFRPDFFARCAQLLDGHGIKASTVLYNSVHAEKCMFIKCPNTNARVLCKHKNSNKVQYNNPTICENEYFLKIFPLLWKFSNNSQVLQR